MAKNGTAQKPSGNPRDLVGNAPWWLISAGIHVVVLLTTTLLYIESQLSVDTQNVLLQDMPSRPKLTWNGGASQEAAADDVDPCIGGLAHVEDDLALPLIRPDVHTEGGGKDGGSGTIGVGGESGTNPGEWLWGCLDESGRGGFGRRRGRGDRIPRLSREHCCCCHCACYCALGFDHHHDHMCDLGRSNHVPSLALIWLARHQGPDGSWSAAEFSDQCHGKKCVGAGHADNSTGVTGLAVLAFLGAGYTHLSAHGYMQEPRDPTKRVWMRDVVKKALRWLVANQDADGCVGPKVARMMYNHAIAAAALVEAYGITEAPYLRGPSQKAIDYLIAAKNPYEACWYYATLALFQYDGTDCGGTGESWKPWNKAIRQALQKNQHTKADGCAEGSWDADDRWGFEGGRVYAVAINALTMEVYQRYPNFFGFRTRKQRK